MMSFGTKQVIPVNLVTVLLGSTIEVLVEGSESGPNDLVSITLTLSLVTHGMKFLFLLPFAIAWKNLVFSSPSPSQDTLAHCFQKIFSCLITNPSSALKLVTLTFSIVEWG